MVHLSFVTTLIGGSLDLPGQSVAFGLSASGSAPQVMLYDFGYGEAQEFMLGANGATRLETWVIDTGAHQTFDIAGYGLGTLDTRFLTTNTDSAFMDQQGAVTMSLNASGPDGFGQGAFADQASVLVMDIGAAAPWTFVATANGQGITAFQIDDTGVVSNRMVTADTDARYLDGVTDMIGLTLDGQSYLYATSARDHGLSGWEVSDNCSLIEVAQIGQDQSLPVQAMTALVTGSSGDAQFLVAWAAGSSTLSVMQVGAGGVLTITDHVLDTRDTRFANVTELEAVTHEDRPYVLAAGSDYGVSLFTVTAEGRLVHLQSLANSEGVALGGVSGMIAVLRDGGIDLLTVAAHDAGMSLFRVDLPEDGVVQSAASGTVLGSAGDDMLSLRTGAGEMDAGAGDDGIIAGSGHDLVYAGDGNDNVPGKAGNNTIYGEDGDDSLGGSDGFDFIFGGAGNDVAGGGNQNDTMDGGPGNDWFSGG